MNLIKITIIIVILLLTSINAKCTKLSMQLHNIEINDFIKVVSRYQKKNILISTPIKGKVSFIASKKVCKEELIDILQFTLESKGYTLIKAGGIYRVIKIVDSSKNNLPIVNENSINNYHQMITMVYNIKYENVDYLASKIRHFLSKSAKLVTSNLTNSIIITDYPNNIKTIKEIIDLIQRHKKKSVELVVLKNINAKDSVNELKNVAKTVFNNKIENEKIEIIANKNINSIMIIGKKQNVLYIKNYLNMLDKKGKHKEYIVDVIYLKNAEAKNIAKMLKEIVDKKKYHDEIQKPHISVDEDSNYIILMGPRNEITYIKNILQKLDTDRQQVYVKARIIEVNIEKASRLGIKYGLEGGGVTNEGLLNFTGNFGGSANVVSSLISAPLLQGLGSSLTEGLLLGININMMKNGGVANMVSEPSILCMNNKESSIYAGETTSIITGTTTTTTGTQNQTKREDVGLKLTVKPRISNGDKVTLEIEVVQEDVKNSDPEKGILDTTKKEIKTTAILNHGESIIIGGLIKNKVSKAVTKIPLLGDIWGLGWLFKYKYEKKEKVNLVVILTPYIISKTSDLSTLRKQLEHLNILEYKAEKEFIKAIKKHKTKDTNSHDN